MKNAIFTLAILFSFFCTQHVFAAYSQVNSRGQTYYLHSKDVQLRGSGRTQTIYYFAKEVKDGALDDIPAGKTIVENERTGLLFLKGKGISIIDPGSEGTPYFIYFHRELLDGSGSTATSVFPDQKEDFDLAGFGLDEASSSIRGLEGYSSTIITLEVIKVTAGSSDQVFYIVTMKPGSSLTINSTGDVNLSGGGILNQEGLPSNQSGSTNNFLGGKLFSIYIVDPHDASESINGSIGHVDHGKTTLTADNSVQTIGLISIAPSNLPRHDDTAESSNNFYIGNVEIFQKSIQYTDPVEGDLTVNEGELVILNSSVSGNVNINGGALILGNANIVSGNVSLDDNGKLIVTGGATIDGNINIGKGSVVGIQDASTVNGNINAMQSLDSLFITGSNINGDISVTKATSIFLVGNQISGNLEKIQADVCNIFDNEVSGNTDTSGCTSKTFNDLDEKFDKQLGAIFIEGGTVSELWENPGGILRVLD